VHVVALVLSVHFEAPVPQATQVLLTV